MRVHLGNTGLRADSPDARGTVNVRRAVVQSKRNMLSAQQITRAILNQHSSFWFDKGSALLDRAFWRRGS